jgi:hypothetical protein
LKHKLCSNKSRQSLLRTKAEGAGFGAGIGGDAMAFSALGIIALLSFLIGALLALRWSVLVLLPAIGAALVLVALLAAARGESAGSLAIELLVTVTCMETGYVARLIAYALVDAARIAATAAATGARTIVTRASSRSLPGLTGNPSSS